MSVCMCVCVCVHWRVCLFLLFVQLTISGIGRQLFWLMCSLPGFRLVKKKFRHQKKLKRKKFTFM